MAGYRRRTTLNVYINVSTQAGQDDLPAELAGHGVITADTVRALAASADTVRALITRPITRTVLRCRPPSPCSHGGATCPCNVASPKRHPCGLAGLRDMAARAQVRKDLLTTTPCRFPWGRECGERRAVP